MGHGMHYSWTIYLIYAVYVLNIVHKHLAMQNWQKGAYKPS